MMDLQKGSHDNYAETFWRDIYLDQANHEEMRGDHKLADNLRRIAINLPPVPAFEYRPSGKDRNSANYGNGDDLNAHSLRPRQGVIYAICNFFYLLFIFPLDKIARL